MSSGVGLGDVRYRKTKPYKDINEGPIYDPREEYFKRKPSHTILGLPLGDLRIIAGLVLIAIFVRLYRISEPTSVVFDEVHFGGFASKYIKGRFFMDVHPPLAKLLITLASLIGGFDGNFDFKEIGKDYLEPGVPYVAMRLLPGILGICVVPIAYLTIKQAGFSTVTAALVSALLIFENGLTTQSRHILLDSPLIFFTAFTVLMWVNFHSHYNKPFTFWWWFWMAMTGVGLGLTVSVKWVGLFTIAFIGFSTVKGLWNLLGDLRVSPELWVRHFVARTICLILIPVTIYAFIFSIHFAILTNSGEGDGFMSPEFQQTIGGHRMENTPRDIAYGARITIRHLNTQGGYLHSHAHDYPTGSKQQQVTLYPHQDENNDWIILNRTNPETPYESMDPIWVYHGDVIRLKHVLTDRKLHSHDVRPPVTDVDYQNEVSAYGFPGFDGDDNDLWRVDIIEHDKSDSSPRKQLRTLHSKFRLVHILSGCHLLSHKVKLPDWGYDQQEVTCISGGTKPNTLWYIESNSHPNLPPDVEMVNYQKPGFFAKFFELQRVMWTTNAGLTDSHPYDSRPTSWLFLRRGISFWGKDHRHIYLLGNPLVWWCSTVAVFLFALAKIVIIFRAKRGYLDHLNATKEFYDSYATFFFGGWFLHWFPFLLMSRQLFLHHYFPALYFSILMFGVTFDLFTIPLSVRKRASLALIFLLAALYVFRLFSPLTYGSPFIKTDCQKLKWISTWDFDCNQFYDTYEEFSQSAQTTNVIPSTSSPISSPTEAPETNSATEAAHVRVRQNELDSPTSEQDNTTNETNEQDNATNEQDNTRTDQDQTT